MEQVLWSPLFAKYADSFVAEALRRSQPAITFLDYDWSLTGR
ncbi:MAG: hypothetical protein AB2A00_18535 [Myxococcota bacterium]